MMELMRVIYGPAEGDHVIAILRNQENPLREESYRLKPISMHDLAPTVWPWLQTEFLKKTRTRIGELPAA